LGFSSEDETRPGVTTGLLDKLVASYFVHTAFTTCAVRRTSLRRGSTLFDRKRDRRGTSQIYECNGAPGTEAVWGRLGARARPGAGGGGLSRRFAPWERCSAHAQGTDRARDGERFSCRPIVSSELEVVRWPVGRVIRRRRRSSCAVWQESDMLSPWIPLMHRGLPRRWSNSPQGGEVSHASFPGVIFRYIWAAGQQWTQWRGDAAGLRSAYAIHGPTTTAMYRSVPHWCAETRTGPRCRNKWTKHVFL